jgi:hypothetical protein
MSEALDGYFVDDNEASISESDSFIGLLLDKHNDNALSRSSLILPRNEYKRGSKFRVKLEGNEQVLEMGAALMKQREWVRVAMPA